MTDAILYTVGGTVQASGGVYLRRRADDELLELCRDGVHAHVLTSRQMGKSSLMVNTAQALSAEGTHCVILDLSQLGTRLEAEAWYLGILTTVEEELELETDAIGWWRERAHLGPSQRLTQFFEEVVMPEVDGRVVVFVDEIDTTLSLDFADDFFAAVRYLHNSRSRVPELAHLSFVLIGVATPGELIQDPERTPFNIGERVELTDFTLEEALPLARGLNPQPEAARQILAWALEWTGGHPYLTQRLCRAIAGEDHEAWSRPQVEETVAHTFFGERGERDHNLQFVRAMLLRRAADPVKVLRVYRDVRRGRQSVRDDPRSPTLSHLKLSGLVRHERGRLEVRNPIYRRVFDLSWVKTNWPVPWLRRLQPAVLRLSMVSIVLLSVVVGLLYRQLKEQERARRETEEQVRTILLLEDVETDLQRAQLARDLAEEELRQFRQALAAEIEDLRSALKAAIEGDERRFEQRRIEDLEEMKPAEMVALLSELRKPSRPESSERPRSRPAAADLEGLAGAIPYLGSGTDLETALEALETSTRSDDPEEDLELLLSSESSLNLWLLDAASGSSRALSRQGGYTSAKLSADGRQISFLRNGRLGIMAASGGDETFLGENDDYLAILGWNSEKGDYLLLTRNRQLYRLFRIGDRLPRLPVRDSKVERYRLVTFLRLAATSTDGRWLYGFENAGNTWQVLEDSPDYDEPKRLAEIPGSFLNPRWSDDGRTVVFVSDRTHP